MNYVMKKSHKESFISVFEWNSSFARNKLGENSEYTVLQIKSNGQGVVLAELISKEKLDKENEKTTEDLKSELRNLKEGLNQAIFEQLRNEEKLALRDDLLIDITKAYESQDRLKIIAATERAVESYREHLETEENE